MLCNQWQQCSVYGKAHSKSTTTKKNIKSVARLRKIACELSEIQQKKILYFFFDIITGLYGMINNNLTL